MNHHWLLALGALLLPLAASAQRPNPHRQLDALLKEGDYFYDLVKSLSANVSP